MTYTNNHPTLIATSRCGSQVLNDLDSVAEYILKEGVHGDIHMIDIEGNLFMTTNGIFSLLDLNSGLYPFTAWITLHLTEFPDTFENAHDIVYGFICQPLF